MLVFSISYGIINCSTNLFQRSKMTCPDKALCLTQKETGIKSCLF